VYLKKWVGKSYISLFILQTVQKFGEVAGDALRNIASFRDKTKIQIIISVEKTVIFAPR